jgi:hypothetical protein
MEHECEPRINHVGPGAYIIASPVFNECEAQQVVSGAETAIQSYSREDQHHQNDEEDGAHFLPP